MFFLHFLKNLIIKNPIKLLMIGSLILLWHLGDNLKPVIEEVSFIQSFKYESQWLFIARESDGDYTVLTFDKEPKVTDQKIIYQSANTAIIPIGFAFIVISIVLVVTSLIPEEDFNWNFSEIWETAKSDSTIYHISCEIEDDIFYYIYKGRLLAKSKSQLSSYDLEKRIDKFPYSTLPRFFTKQERRDRKLKDLFNEN